MHANRRELEIISATSPSGGEPDFALSSETPGGYVWQAALPRGSSIGWQTGGSRERLLTCYQPSASPCSPPFAASRLPPIPPSPSPKPPHPPPSSAKPAPPPPLPLHPPPPPPPPPFPFP